MSKNDEARLPMQKPGLPEGHFSINDRLWFENHDGCISVFLVGISLYWFDCKDLLMRRFVSVKLRLDGHATQQQIASAFGHSLRSQSRWEKAYREEGLSGLIDGKRTGGPRALDDQARVYMAGWFEQGVSKREIGRRLGVDEITIRRELERMGFSREEEEALFEGDESTEVSWDEDAVEEEDGEETPEEEEERLPLRPLGTLDTDPLCRLEDRKLARDGLLDDAVPYFADAEALPRAGVLLAIPFLVAGSTLSIFEKIYLSLGPAFYGLRNTVVALFLMALLRIKCAENLKEHLPSDLGRIMGLDRMAEVKTVRRKLSRLAAAGRGEELMHALAEQRVEDDQERIGYVYLDGHVREYHGQHPLGKAHLTGRRISAPAETDTWVNDANGDPLFVVTRELNPGLTKILPEALKDVRRLAGKDRKVTVVFDRGGYSPRLFRQLVAAGFDIITYRKGEKDPIPERKFCEVQVEEDGKKKILRIHDKKRVPIGNRERRKGKKARPWLTMRQVSILRDDGRMTQILTTLRDLSVLEVCVQMFARWRQENSFKYMLAEYALDALCEYGADDLPEDADRPNPERKKLEKERKKTKSRLDALLAQLGQELEDNDESRRRTVRGMKIANAKLRRKIAAVMNELEALTTKIKELPKRVNAGDLKQLKRDRRLVVDAIKMVAYQVETDLHRMLFGRYARADDEGRTLLTGIFQSKARIEVGDEELRVTISKQSAPHKTKVLKELCEQLNTTDTKFPGSDLRLVFATEEHEPVTL